MLDRRDALRLLSLAVLAVGASQTLTACGETADGPRRSDMTSAELEQVSSQVVRAPGSLKDLPAAVASLHALGAGLYSRLAARDGNLALSPYSAGVALALAANGAVGPTQDEMLGVLDAADVESLNSGLNALTAYVDSLAGTRRREDGTTAELRLTTANTLFGQRSTAWEQDFLDTLAREYSAGMIGVDYVGDPEAARNAINRWTAERTADKIRELLAEGTVHPLTRLVLVNAVYLKAPWESVFEDFLTEPRPFTRVDGTVVTVPTMTNPVLATTVVTGDGWQAARLPYAGRALAMTVVLPDEGRLADVESQVGEGGLPQMLGRGEPAQLALSLPRWTFRTNAGLGEALEQLGMRLAFDPAAADLSAMTVEQQLFVEAVVQEVFIAVDEEGTEAAAATAVLAGTTSAPITEPFVVDRPFLFVIHDVEHGTPLFVGRVVDPSEE